MQLRELGRYADAEIALKEALAQEPNDAFALHQLAVCQFHQTDKRREALETIGRALALDPNSSEHHILKSFILSGLSRSKEALTSARDALALDPYESGAFAAEAQAHLQMEHWADAERAAREALALDADSSVAANQLAQALRLQNKLAENTEHLSGMLARDPEDPFTHANAGWTALQRGGHREAEEHFREALRLDPDFDYAREGLLNSFRARSPLYRAYLQYCFLMQRLSGGTRWAVIIGLYIAFRYARSLTGTAARPYAIAFCVLYLVFVLWVWVAKGVGNFILLWDRFAKYALRPAEKLEAAFVGGGVLVGLPILFLGIGFDIKPMFVLGAGLVAAAFPLSITFTNEAKFGRMFFGAIGFGTLAVTLITLGNSIVTIIPEKTTAAVFVVMLLACGLSTLLALIPGLRKLR
jgi:Tfp pilus assembly protein PilF